MADKCDDLKYRNEIEVMSRLRGYKVDNLYSDSINSKVESSINDLYEHKCYEVIFTSTDYVPSTNYRIDELIITNTATANNSKQKCNVEFNVLLCGGDVYYFHRWLESVIRYKDEKFPRVKYKVEAILLMYDEQCNLLKRFKLFEVYPISVDPPLLVDSEYYTYTFEANDIEEWSLNEDENTRSENIICGNDLYIENKNLTVDDVLKQSKLSWDSYLKVTLDSYDCVEDKVTYLLNVIQLCTSLLKSFFV